MSEKKITYQEAMARDKLLFDLSMYDACQGMMHILKSQEDMSELHEKTVQIFNRHKKLVQSGEFTFEEIMDDIIERNAAYPRNLKSVNFSSDESVKRMLKIFEKNDLEREKNKIISEKFNFLNNLLSGLKIGGDINDSPNNPFKSKL